MTDALRWLLRRAEIQDAAPISAREVWRWGPGAVDRFVDLGLLRKTTPARYIRYDGCDHGCSIEPEIVTDPATGDRFGVHRCMQDECGLVRVPLDELLRWEFDLFGTARAVAKAVDAGGQVVEDVSSRLVEVGRVDDGQVWRDLFLARGLAWDDAATVLAGARRLKASGAPLVLGLAMLPEQRVWADCKPAIALLSDIASLDGRLTVDLDAALERPTDPHPDSVESEWLTVTEAADRLLEADVLDGYNMAKAKTRISTAATRGELVSNGEKGTDRRLESGSLARWMLQLRRQELAEDYNEPRRRRRRRGQG